MPMFMILRDINIVTEYNETNKLININILVYLKRKRIIKSEEKTKVVAAVWGTEYTSSCFALGQF